MRHSLTRCALGAVLVLPVAACGNHTTGSVSPNDFADGSVATMANVNDPAWPSDAVTVDSAWVTGATLRLAVRYGGGCRNHRFALLLGNAFMESYPVQVHARLAHDAAGDMCRALLSKTLAFDLTRLQARYRASYGAGAATIVLNFVGQSLSVRYSFD